MSSIPKNKALYDKIKAEAKKKFKVWPSAYASGWLVKEYKKRGGTYGGTTRKNNKKTSKTPTLTRWFSEKWINVCKLPKIVSCGRPKTTLENWKKDYPYCRPLKRVSKHSPKTARELSKKEIEKRCKKKKKSPLKKVY